MARRLAAASVMLSLAELPQAWLASSRHREGGGGGGGGGARTILVAYTARHLHNSAPSTPYCDLSTSQVGDVLMPKQQRALQLCPTAKNETCRGSCVTQRQSGLLRKCARHRAVALVGPLQSVI